MANLVSVVFIVLAAAIHSGQSWNVLSGGGIIPDTNITLLCSKALDSTDAAISNSTALYNSTENKLDTAGKNCTEATNKNATAIISQFKICYNNASKPLYDLRTNITTTCKLLSSNTLPNPTAAITILNDLSASVPTITANTYKALLNCVNIAVADLQQAASDNNDTYCLIS